MTSISGNTQPQISITTGFEVNALNQTQTQGIIDKLVTMGYSAEDAQKQLEYLQDSNSPALPPPNESAIQNAEPYPKSTKAYILIAFNVYLSNQATLALQNHQPPLTELQMQEVINQLADDTFPVQKKLDDAGITLSDDESAELSTAKQQAASRTQDLFGLPPKWTPNSNSDADWTPTNSQGKVQPYTGDDQQTILDSYNQQLELNITSETKGLNLTDNQMAVLRTLIADPNSNPVGSTPELLEMAKTIQERTLLSTKAKFDLPDAWTPAASADSINWTPINTINPQKLAAIQGQLILQATLTQLEETAVIMENLINILPANDPRRESLKNYLAKTLHAIQMMKLMMYSSVTADAKKTLALAGDQQALLTALISSFSTLMAEQKEAQKDAEEAAKISLYVQIGAIVLAALAVLLAPFTGGASLALLAVALVMLAVTIADFVYAQVAGGQGFIAEGMKLGMTELKESLQAENANLPDWAGELIIAGAAVIIIVALVFATILTGGAAAGAAITAGKVIGQAALMFATQTVIQLLIASGAITTLIAAGLKEAGVEDLEWLKILLNVIIMILLMLAGAGQAKAAVSGMSSNLANNATKAVTSWEKFAKSMGKYGEQMTKLNAAVQVAGNIGTAGAEISIAMIYLELADRQLKMGELEASMAYIQVFLKMIQTIMQNLQGKMSVNADFANSLNTLQNSILQKQSRALDNIAGASSAG